MTLYNYFSSFKDNIDKKVRNPFFSTFTIVLVLNNWQLFYSLFYFDSTNTRTIKIEIIEKYIADAGGTFIILLWTLVLTLVAMFSAYCFQSIGVLSSNFYDSVIYPNLVSFSSKGTKVVTKIDYDTLKEQYKRLEIQHDDESKRRQDAKSMLEKVEKEFADYRISISEGVKVKGNQNLVVNKENETLLAENENRAEKIAQKIYDDSKNKTIFSNIIAKINYGKSIDITMKSEGEFVNYLLIQNVVDYNKKNGSFMLSEFGENVKEYFLSKTI